MRGAYGAGVLAALEQLMGREPLNVLVGNSAGAGIVCGLLAIGSERMKQFWTKQIKRGDFIPHFKNSKEFRGALKMIMNELGIRMPWMQDKYKTANVRWFTDIDYLMEACRKVGFSNEAMRKAKTQVYISVTRADTGMAHFFSGKDDVFEAFHASVSIPIVSKTPVIVEGIPCLDGGISVTLRELIDKALTEGAEKVVVVDLSSPLNPLERWGLRRYAKRQREGLKNAIIRMTEAEHPERLAPDARVYLIRPRETMVTRLRFSLEKLQATYERGLSETLNDYNLKAFLNVVN